MFYTLGIKQLLKNKRVLWLSILAISIGVGMLYTVNISADTVQYTVESRTDALFGNVDYTVYRTGEQYFDNETSSVSWRSNRQFYDNSSFGIPLDHSEAIRTIPGVERVVARAQAHTSFYGPDDTTIYYSDVAAIDVENPDEVHIGVSNMTSIISGINPTLEDALNYTGAIRPVVLSERLVLRHGFEMGDTIRILPANATKLYGTVDEKAAYDAGTKEQKAAIEKSIRDNASRIVQFTIVGFINDGSEAPSRGIGKDDQSLTGLVPSEMCIYARLNDTLAWVHNRVDGEVAFFMVTAKNVAGGARAFDATISTNATVEGIDVRAHFQGYIDYVSILIRVVLSTLLVSAIISCGVLIKTVAQMNIDEKKREIGILRAIGFKKNAVSEIVVSQVMVMSVIGTAAGLVIGLIPPQFFDVSEISRFISYNKTYDMNEVIVIVSLVSSLIAIAAGLILPIVSAMMPILAMRKWSVVEMMTPGYMQSRALHDGKKKKKQGRRSRS